MNWGEINDFGQIVGMSETAVPDPNGEDICGFSTHLTCRPFVWQNFHMSALPTLGGNNGQASAINNLGQIAGMAENGTVDSSCTPETTANRTQLPVLWEHGRARALPTPVGDADGFAVWINDYGQAVGYTGNCGAMSHAVSWENGKVTKLEDLGTGDGAIAYGNNKQGQIVGSVFASPGGAIRYAALWQNGVLTNLGTLTQLGDIASIATGTNDQGQVVGSTWDSNFNWSNAFIYQDGVMTNLNTLHAISSRFHPPCNHGEQDQQSRTNLGHGNGQEWAGYGQGPRLSGNPCRLKHRHVGCRSNWPIRKSVGFRRVRGLATHKVT